MTKPTLLHVHPAKTLRHPSSLISFTFRMKKLPGVKRTCHFVGLNVLRLRHFIIFHAY